MLKTTTKPQPIEKILQTIERQLHDLNRIERERERLAAGLSIAKGLAPVVMEVLK